MTGYYLIPKTLKNLNPDAIESFSVAFDADLPCREIFRWKLKGGDLKLVIIMFIKIYMGCNLH